jgi:Lrp/AsnC family transcriptional regulator for asnA, asnC and gidA
MAGRAKVDQEVSGGILRVRAAQKPKARDAAVTLDDLDRDIIEMHQKDLTFSYAHLAAKWGVTVATIRNRIKRLKAAGVMEIVLVLNPKKVGFEVFAVIGVRLVPGTDVDAAMKRIMATPGVTSVIMVAGRYDLFVHCFCEDIEAYKQLIGNRLRKIPAIQSTEGFIGIGYYGRRFEVGATG